MKKNAFAKFHKIILMKITFNIYNTNFRFKFFIHIYFLIIEY